MGIGLKKREPAGKQTPYRLSRSLNIHNKFKIKHFQFIP
jgi:hypothetical protein